MSLTGINILARVAREAGNEGLLPGHMDTPHEVGFSCPKEMQSERGAGNCQALPHGASLINFI